MNVVIIITIHDNLKEKRMYDYRCFFCEEECGLFFFRISLKGLFLCEICLRRETGYVPPKIPNKQCIACKEDIDALHYDNYDNEIVNCSRNGFFAFRLHPECFDKDVGLNILKGKS